MIRLLFIFFFSQSVLAQSDYLTTLEGNWLGIDMYQDQETYDGKNYFLPNDEFIIIENGSLKVYFYPYFKSDEFQIRVTKNQIIHDVGSKKIETDYRITGAQKDTLVFTMHFINKTFVKMYTRVTSTNQRMEVDFATVKELDEFGFNPSSITHLFELDTFHNERFSGFEFMDSLPFEPYAHLQFINDKQLSVNREEVVNFERGYKTVRFVYQNQAHEITLSRIEGTQSFSIIPNSLCGCDDLTLPYMTSDWADRIRKDMRENAYKYKN